jgi:hypothetical protein
VEVKLYGWDPTAEEFVKVRCDSNGNLLVDVSSMTFDVLLLNPQSTPPTAVEGGVYYLDTDNSVYVGVE